MPNKFSERLNDLAAMIDPVPREEVVTSRSRSESIASGSTTVTGTGVEAKSRTRKGSVSSAAKTFYTTHFAMDAKDQEDLNNLLNILSIAMKRIRNYIRHFAENEELKFIKRGYPEVSEKMLGEIAAPFRYSFPPLHFAGIDDHETADVILDLCATIMDECEARQDFDKDFIASTMESSGLAYKHLQIAARSVIADQNYNFFMNLMNFKTPPAAPRTQSIQPPPVPRRLSKTDDVGKPPLAPKRVSATRGSLKNPGPVIPPRPTPESMAKARSNSLQGPLKPIAAPKVAETPPPIPRRPKKI